MKSPPSSLSFFFLYFLLSSFHSFFLQLLACNWSENACLLIKYPNMPVSGAADTEDYFSWYNMIFVLREPGVIAFPVSR
jgi:hypothetical protein